MMFFFFQLNDDLRWREILANAIRNPLFFRQKKRRFLDVDFSTGRAHKKTWTNWRNISACQLCLELLHRDIYGSRVLLYGVESWALYLHSVMER